MRRGSASIRRSFPAGVPPAGVLLADRISRTSDRRSGTWQARNPSATFGRRGACRPAGRRRPRPQANPSDGVADAILTRCDSSASAVLSVANLEQQVNRPVAILDSFPTAVAATWRGGDRAVREEESEGAASRSRRRSPAARVSTDGPTTVRFVSWAERRREFTDSLRRRRIKVIDEIDCLRVRRGGGRAKRPGLVQTSAAPVVRLVCRQLKITSVNQIRRTSCFESVAAIHRPTGSSMFIAEAGAARVKSTIECTPSVGNFRWITVRSP